MTPGPRPAAALRIPVLLYHAVSDDPPSWIAPFSVRPRDFAAHLDAVADSGRTAVTVSRLADGLAGRAPLPERPVVITVDDGFADLPAYTAPALAARGLTATAYLTTGALGPHTGGSLLPPAPMMTLRQARDVADCGLEVGAHTVSHPQLDTLPAPSVRRELAQPKALLEDLLGRPVPAFAYPHGYSSPAVRRLVRAAGYTSAAAVRNAFSSAGDEPYRIARLMLRSTDSAQRVAGWLAGEGAPAAPFRDGPAVLGWRLYRRARRVLRGPTFAG